MLVVLAIIAILTAILLPVLSRVREEGRSAQCKSNLHQLGLAMQQYVDDNGKYPLWLTDSPPWAGVPGTYISNGPGWAFRIKPYIGSLQVFRCPSKGEQAGVKENIVETDGLVQTIGVHYTDYSFNANLSGLSSSLIKHPVNIVLLGDTNSSITNSSAYSDGNPPTMRESHFDKSNYLFADGHVKIVSFSAMGQVCRPITINPDSAYSFCND